MSHKLPTPGGAVRERSFGEDVGAGAVAAAQGRRGVFAHFSAGRDGDPSAGGGRSNAISLMHAGVASSSPALVQPPPLASRSGGAAGSAKQDAIPTSSSALGSSWIRRVLPTTPDHATEDLGQDVVSTSPPGTPRAVGAAGSQSGNALMFVSTSPSQNLRSPEPQSSRELAARIVANGQSLLKEQKSQDLLQEQRMSTHGGDSADSAFNSTSSDKSYAIEGAAKHLPHQGTSRGAEILPPEHEHGGRDDEPERMVPGFGSLRPVKSRANDAKPSEKPVRGARPPLFPEKANGLDAEDVRAAAAPAAGSQRNGFRIPTVSPKLARLPVPGKQTLSSVPQFNPSKDPKFGREIDRPPRHAATGGFIGSRAAQRFGLELDQGRQGVNLIPSAAGNMASPCVASSGSASCVGCEVAHGSGIEYGNAKFIERSASNIIPVKAPVPSQRQVCLNRDDNFVHKNERHQLSRDKGELSSGLGLPGESSKAPENRAPINLRSGDNNKRHRDAGVFQFPEASPHATRLLQGDSPAGNSSHPSSHAPPSVFARGEEGDQTQALLTPLFGSPRTYADGSDGRVRHSEKQAAPWTPSLSPFEGQKQPELHYHIPPHAMGLFPSFHSRFFSAPAPNHSATAPKESDNHRKIGADWHVTSGTSATQNLAGAREPFDLSSSPFLRGLRPGDEDQDPNEDVASCHYSNSQRTANAHHSPGVARAANDFRDTHSHGNGAENVGYGRSEEARESSAREDGCGRFTESQAEVGRSYQMQNDRDQDYLASFWRYAHASTASGERNEFTSGSSPPSHPPGYNSSSDVGSPGRRSTGQRTMPSQPGSMGGNIDVDGVQTFMRQAGYTETSAELRFRRGKSPAHTHFQERDAADEDVGKFRDFFGKDLDARKVRPPNGLGLHDVSMKTPSPGSERAGEKHNRSSTLDVVEDNSNAGPAKRNRHDVDSSGHRSRLGLHDVSMKTPSPGSERAGEKHNRSSPLDAVEDNSNAGPAKRNRHDVDSSGHRSWDQNSPGPVEGKPSVWLQRWLKPASTGQSGLGRSSTDDVLQHNQAGFGRINFMQRFGGKQESASPEGAGADTEDRFQARIGRRSSSGVQAFVAHPTPSAAALALASAAARKSGPVPQQRKGSLNFWAPVRFPTRDTPKTPESP